MDVTSYIDDFGIWKMEPLMNTWSQVDKILQTIGEGNLTTNALKRGRGVKQSDFLGYELILTSCKPMKKIDTLWKMSSPSIQKEVRSCLGATKFLFKSMRPRRTRVLASLTRLSI